ncbi:insulinase family protein [Hassallia byssoidea VB512170]|uniref:Insulinase family protein n=1 Tax=Hassallia byssoidea VB512170 TaxID=1304833 RepID=A0A846GZF3_9CYAN|nr:pitrilysin family protein [Hassalia byssoidea]NEU71257.1 insulinase family protein [Hassalia byssoidea VB512170]
MSVFSTLRKYRYLLLMLSVWLIAVLFLSHKPADSKLMVAYNQVSSQKILIAKKPTSRTVTENVNKTVLENGLTVLTKEVHTAPVVTVQVWYKVGSRNEEPGVNGIAHQLEHMMFKGTRDRPIQFGRLFSALGSDSNAFTSYDQTAYYGTLEREKLKALLVLEADRMQNSLIDAQQLASEKQVVISELQGYENSPDYRLNRAVMQAAFPQSPYGLPVGGTKADVEKFQVEQVRKYYRNFYTPNNAVLVIVGDFDTAKTTKAVQEIFGKIPKSQQSIVKSQESIVNGQQSIVKSQESIVNSQQSKFPLSPSPPPIVLREPGSAGLLQAVYPLPQVNHPDVPALSVMDYILTEGRNSRFYQALVESGLASDVTASVASLLESGWYKISVTAAPHQDLRKIDSVLNSEISKLAFGVTSKEVKRAKTQLEASVILSNRDITNQAMQLANDELTTGNYLYTERYLEAVREVTEADVRRVVNKYLQQEARTVGFFEPTQKQVKGNGGKANSVQTTENFTSLAPVAPVEVMKYLPSVEKTSLEKATLALPQKFTFGNGLRVLLLPDKSTPTVTLSGYLKAGAEFDPKDKAGLASLVADNLMNGTKTKDVLTLAQALEERGANLDLETYKEGVRIQANSLAADLPVLIQILADGVKNATFPAKELELTRQQALNALELELDDPNEVAERTFLQSIYPKNHPSHTFPTEKSLRKISREDVLNFKAKHYRPDTTVLVLVGDFEPTKVRSLLQTQFSDWQVSGKPPKLKYPAVSIPEKVVRVNSVLPGKAQAITYMGYIGINRQDPRFYAALILNQILGGDTLSSRLGAEVRDRLGLTYGIYSYFQAGKNIGTFLIEMQTSPEDASKAIASTRNLLQQLHTHGVSTQEVETAKRTLISNYTVTLANPQELTKKILMNEVYGLDEMELRSFTQKIQTVNLAQVNLAARELLHPDKIVVVTAGPAVLAHSS